MDIKKVEAYVKNKLEADKTGHDYQHIKRVVNNCKKIYENMSISDEDKNIIISAALVHDLIDYKLVDDIEKEKNKLIGLLEESNYKDSQIKEIIYIIENMSFSANIDGKKELSLLGKIVQDADRLDAIGAIGIARTFYYGGSKGHHMYDDLNKNQVRDLNKEEYLKGSTVIDHFYEKLLKIKDLMNTKEGLKITEERHKFMEEYLDNFYREVE
ncbi:HD domain-containing protein [Helcococcus massiliensis]|uniref:HD domain-containing protein n=1 Tax=Helcococcus massiliensis TaxID=2040290 RepID=UPI0013564F67|nr:HD domain-containing protein [Helcococcus massiliensis]